MTETQTATPTRTQITRTEFVTRWNQVAKGEAKFDERSKNALDGKTKEVKVEAKVGEAVPATRMGVAAYNGVSYNATVVREKAYRDQIAADGLDSNTILLPINSKVRPSWGDVAESLQIEGVAKLIGDEDAETDA